MLLHEDNGGAALKQMTGNDHQKRAVAFRVAQTLRQLAFASTLALGAAAPAAWAQGFLSSDPVRAVLIDGGGGNREIRAFYVARGHRPFWVRNGVVRPEADQVIALLETAGLDGLKPRSYRIRAIRSAIADAALGDPEALAEAELLLSENFARYVQDLRRERLPRTLNTGMLVADAAALSPIRSKADILAQAATAPSLEAYLQTTAWMHPIYGQLRDALARALDDGGDAARLRLNLERARPLPAADSGRHVIVDAAGQRLLMYDKGTLQGSMKVVVGRQDNPTPMLAAVIRYAILNPYWNVPEDLVKDRIAPHVLAEGPAYLKAKRYDVLSDWSANASVADPKLVDWPAVAAGLRHIRMRQRPGPDNGMGRMKFMLPNQLGIYLHDTPDKGLFSEAGRNLSAGCVRVEDAARLARWLFGKPIAAKAGKVEHQVDLPRPVPVYITYFTAFAEGQRVVIRDDPYGRDVPSKSRRRNAG